MKESKGHPIFVGIVLTVGVVGALLIDDHFHENIAGKAVTELCNMMGIN